MTKSDIDYKKELLNILAIIHRDGGHYTIRKGILNSIKDAKKIITSERNAENRG